MWGNDKEIQRGRAPIRTQLPRWSFNVALFLSEQRRERFQNRFRNTRLRQAHAGQPYLNECESIVGYMGDIGAAVRLDLDPVQILHEMIDATDGLYHRDEADLFVNGRNIDVKIEDYANHHEAVLTGRARPEDPYGCRLINEGQWEENRTGVDAYLFGCFDPPLTRTNPLHIARSLAWIGCISSGKAASAQTGRRTPAGLYLHVPARMIPNDWLSSPDALLAPPPGDRSQASPPADHHRRARLASLHQKLDDLTR